MNDVSNRQIDKLIKSGEFVNLTDISGDSGFVKFVSRDRRRITYVQRDGLEGVIERSSIKSIDHAL